jgi:membrane-associated phospholipid phosphatase
VTSAATLARSAPPARRAGRVETVAGAVLIASTMVVAVIVHWHPGPDGLDQWMFSTVGPSPHSSLLIHVTDLGEVPVAVGGSVLAALVAVGRDRRTALACLVGPAVALVLVEWVLKPTVARYYLGVLSFPSGTITAVAAVATAWVVAVPRWLRVPVLLVGAGLVAWAGVAVIALRWHYPSDALAGGAFGVGVVLLLDGILHGAGARR